jgi:hypothetical protein
MAWSSPLFGDQHWPGRQVQFLCTECNGCFMTEDKLRQGLGPLFRFGAGLLLLGISRKLGRRGARTETVALSLADAAARATH